MALYLIKMRHAALKFLCIGIGVILLSGLVLAQRHSSHSKHSSSRASKKVVTEIDATKLKELLRRDPSNARPLLINFWATWCEPCRQEFPDLVKINAQFRPKGLDFITVSLDDVGDIKTKVPQFLGNMHATMPAYLLNTPEQEDAIAAVSKDWSGTLPATFLLNEKGEVVYSHQGKIKTQELSMEIQKLTGEK